jgi:hypothetical protein
MQALDPGIEKELRSAQARALPSNPEAAASIQDVDHGRPRGESGVVDAVLNTLLWTVEASRNHAPAYWSRQRDEWMVDWVKEDGNDLLAGAHSTLVAKIAATSWYVEAPLALAMLYRDILLHRIGWGAGWQPEVSMWTDAFLSRDFGGALENLRSSRTDYTGPSLGFAHMDESKCYPTGIPEWPIIYYNDDKGPIPIHQSQVCWIRDMPDHRDRYRGVGFCSVSRALSTSYIMKMLVDYKEQALSDLPPAAILLLSNMTPSQWKDIEKRYDARQRNQGNTVWQDILVAFGFDPAYPLGMELLELSKVWEHFDERTATDIAMFSFALAYRVDPREYWPVSSGALGTATEAAIQDRKAKGKGEGIIYQAIERQLNRPTCLPPNVRFKFDYQDTEEDKLAAEIRELHIQNIRRLWEASPNRATAGATLPPGEGGGSEEGSEIQQPPPGLELDSSDSEAALGIIDREEARQLLIHWNVVPPEILGEQVEIGRLYDTRAAQVMEAYGPVVRAHRDGRVTVMKRAMTPTEQRAWREYCTGRSGPGVYTRTSQLFGGQ